MPSPLGDYLQARRNHLQPRDVGFPRGARRRAPGLRREEVATLAGVSVDYLVRLEQGRDTNPSASVLAALATALRLNDEERVHLWSLAAMTVGHELCPIGRATAELPVGVHQLLERLQPTPALVLGPATDVLTSNQAWRALVEPLGMLDDGIALNVALFHFHDERAPIVFPDWADVADDLVVSIRRAHTRSPDAAIDRVVDELAYDREFTRRWSNHVVAPEAGRLMRIVHPHVGELRITSQDLFVPGATYVRLATWLPADQASAEAIEQATARTVDG